MSVSRQNESAYCVLANRCTVRLPLFFASHLAPDDEIAFPVPMGEAAGAEIYVSKAGVSAAGQCLYLAPIGHVSKPISDKHHHSFVAAEILRGGLGIAAVYLPCQLLRDYFYQLPSAEAAAKLGLYELLGVSSRAAPAELRIAFKLRTLELEAANARLALRRRLERAFNILGQPELRACYDNLSADPEAPAIFPYGGCGSLLVTGDRTRDGTKFFARRLLAFRPECRQRRFHQLLRKCDFYEDYGLCRDKGRKLEFWIDPAVLHTAWDASWNRWKHLLSAKIEVDATFVQSGKYRKRVGAWELVPWEMALPSRLNVKLPVDFQQQVEAARSTYHRFGQYTRALDQVRQCLEHRAMEKTELEGICRELRIPGDFDISQINWRPDYDPFFYRHLLRRACRVYLFRDEYIFEVEKAVVVETPQLGHASYVFSKPPSMEGFLRLYIHTSKDDIRRNRDNAGERLGFLGRVVHGTNPRAWLKEIQRRIGEKIDSASTVTG